MDQVEKEEIEAINEQLKRSFETLCNHMLGAAWGGDKVKSREQLELVLEQFNNVVDTKVALFVRVKDTEQKLSSVIAHATGGGTPRLNMSLNDICVDITRYRNKIYEGGRDAGKREGAKT